MNSNVPAWYRLAPFLGRPPDLTRAQWRLLGLVAAVSIFEQYDVYLFALALHQIQTELAIPESQLGLLGAVVRAGALLAIIFALAADRFGRRALLLITVLGYTLCTGLTAFAFNTETFVVLQFLARGFAAAEVMIAAVVIAEEFNPEHRGWGIGALAALQACGAGIASILFGFVDHLPWGWRSLYLIGLIPLLLIAYWRRTMPETGRFAEVQDLQVVQPWLQPARDLFAHAPGRAAALFSCVLLFGVVGGTTGFFAPKFLQEVHAWEPSSVAMLMFFGGAFAIVGNPLAGWLSDRYGRRPVSMIFALGMGLLGIAFYSLTGLLGALLWVPMIFALMGSEVTLNTYSTELFDTRFRATAGGIRTMVMGLGAVVGLSAVSGLFLVLHSNWLAIALLCCGSLAIPLIVWRFLPETAGRRLEDI